MKQAILFFITLFVGTQFAKAQSVTTGLVSYYSFNDSTANDQIGDNHGAITGAVSADDRFGNPGFSMYFNGSSTIHIGDSTEINLNNMTSLSISCWAKPDTIIPFLNDLKGIVTKWTNSSTTEQYGLYLNGNKHLFAIGQVYQNGLNFNTVIDTSWKHIVVVYDIPNTSLLYYINGVLSYTTTAANAFPGSTGTSSLLIGSQSGSRFFKGYIDDVAIYNGVLDSAAVATLYNEANPTLPSAISNEIEDKSNINFMPNPSRGTVYFNADANIEAIEVYTLAGQLLHRFMPNSRQGSFELQIHNGLYLLRSIMSDGNVKTDKLLIQR